VTPEHRGGARISGDFVLPPNFERDIEREVERGLRAMPRDFAFDFKWDGEFPTAKIMSRGRLGAQLSPMSDQLADYFGAKQGVLVSSVDADSVAAKAGLKAGDVITSVNGHAVETPREVAQEVRDAGTGKEVTIGVLRDKKSITLKAQIPEAPRPEIKRPTRPV